MRRAQDDSGREVCVRVPRSIEDLIRDAARHVTRSAPSGRWLVAERVLDAGGHHWRVGLTPVTEDLAALVVWADDTVVGHKRGDEITVCAHAHRWITAITTGIVPLR